MLHQPVLLEAAIDALDILTEGIYIDATFGRGGHSQAILSKLGQDGQLIALDQDPDAIAWGRKHLSDPRLQLEWCNFAMLEQVAKDKHLCGKINGILFDLGVSSVQIDTPERGFSFSKDGPLDMRMDPTKGLSAADIIASWDEKALADAIYQFGDERYSRRIARAIVQARQTITITTTSQLVQIICQSMPRQDKHKHPATRTFQALRIVVNRELEVIEQALQAAYNCLAVGGRLAVISFHSLEAQCVKQFLRKFTQGDNLPKNIPITIDKIKPKMRYIVKKQLPTSEEIAANPRARSARLSVAEKLAEV